MQRSVIRYSHHVFIRSSDLTHLIDESLCPLTNRNLLPPPQPVATTFQLSISMTLDFFSLDSTYKRCHALLVLLCLISLSSVPSGPFILSQMAGFPYFLGLNNIPWHVYLISFIHSPLGGHLGYFLFMLIAKQK